MTKVPRIAHGTMTFYAIRTCLWDGSELDFVKTKKPKFKMVLTAIGKFAYRRKEDDVIVCPISALRP